MFRLLSGKDAALDNAAGDEDPVEDWEELTDPSTGGGGLGLEVMSLEDTSVGEEKGAVGAVSGGGQADGEARVMGEDGTGLEVEDDHEEAEEEEDGGQEESMEVMDERLMHSFLNGLKKGLKDAQLPMLVR